jgi:peptide/nickel transport system ATP-binding protein
VTAGLAVADLVVRARDGTRPVDGVSFRLSPGVPLTLLGETGSGKTLIAEAIMGTLAADLAATGSIALDGRELGAASGVDRRRLWGRRLALLPQEPWLALDPTMRAAGQVAEVFRHVRRLGAAEADARTAASLGAVGLAGAARAFPFQLSGGMAQRLAFAATAAGEAPLLIADEPTKGLDATLRDGIAALLRQHAESGGMLLAITHDVTLARALGGAAAILREGRVVEAGPAERVLVAPAHPYARRLLAAEPSAWPEATHPPPGRTVVAARSIAKRYGARPLFSGLSFALAAGETVAVTGPSGAGKTTLGNILVGLVRPDSGTVIREAGGARTRYQKLWQDPPAAFARRVPLGRLMDDLARRHGIAAARLESLLARLRLAPALLGRGADAISGGELQRFALARALLLEPLFLFADEATSRLDPITQQETLALLAETAAERGLALLLVTHDAVIAAKMARRRIVIEGGTARAAC